MMVRGTGGDAQGRNYGHEIKTLGADSARIFRFHGHITKVQSSRCHRVMTSRGDSNHEDL